MKKIAFGCFLLVLIFIPSLALAANPVKIEILYMNHGPLQSTLQEMRTLFAQYGKKISVSWYDIDTENGERFMAKKGIRGHIPLVIWLNDYVKFQVDGKELIFAGFPTGSGPRFFQGKWKMDDLKQILNTLTSQQ